MKATKKPKRPNQTRGNIAILACGIRVNTRSQHLGGNHNRRIIRTNGFMDMRSQNFSIRGSSTVPKSL